MNTNILTFLCAIILKKRDAQLEEEDWSRGSGGTLTNTQSSNFIITETALSRP